MATAHNRRPTGDLEYLQALRTMESPTCQDEQMGRVARCLLVGLSAIIFGVITLAVALWLLVLVDPHTVLQSCGTGSGGTGVQECTPEHGRCVGVVAVAVRLARCGGGRAWR